VHRYNFDLAAIQRLRELIDEYGRMRRLEEMTPQQRGQRLSPAGPREASSIILIVL
jgi:hypothetical protein